MRRLPLVALAITVFLAGSASALAQESQAAKTTRKKLHQKLTIDAKEIGTKALLEDVNRELDQPVRFFIDNASGVSNNTKLSYSGKDVTVEKLLNDLSDKYDFGWVVISNAGNNKVDGQVAIRKSSKGKERGYEAGKAPKKSSLDPRPGLLPGESTPALTRRETRIEAAADRRE